MKFAKEKITDNIYAVNTIRAINDKVFIVFIFSAFKFPNLNRIIIIIAPIR
jgi:hypothetical protein